MVEYKQRVAIEGLRDTLLPAWLMPAVSFLFVQLGMEKTTKYAVILEFIHNRILNLCVC